MTDNVKLLKQRFDIERQIHQIKNTSLSESKQAAAQEIITKLEVKLAQVNEAMGLAKKKITEDDDHMDHTQEPDHEVNMARSELHRAAHAAMSLSKLISTISEQQGLEGWVQAKITKAADYLDTVYHYLEYEMKGNGVEEAVGAYGPGEDPNAVQQAPGAPKQNPMQAKPGSTSPTPPAGGSTPGGATPGMVKMSKLDPQKKPTGTPVMVRSTDIAAKQKQGFAVIGEGKEEKKVVHCSQCGKGFSAVGLKPPHHTGFSHCKDHKGMKIVAEDASAGASSAGGVASSMGNGTGFASGGIGMQKRKKKKIGEGMVDDKIDAIIKKYGVKYRGNVIAEIRLGEFIEQKRNGVKNVIAARNMALDNILEYGARFYTNMNEKFHKERKAAAHAQGKEYRAWEESVEEGTMVDAEKESDGPKFTGYYKGKDKGRPGKKMVGGE